MKSAREHLVERVIRDTNVSLRDQSQFINRRKQFTVQYVTSGFVVLVDSQFTIVDQTNRNLFLRVLCTVTGSHG